VQENFIVGFRASSKINKEWGVGDAPA
jgi:hypothetical protein